jgi:hypothetical protein
VSSCDQKIAYEGVIFGQGDLLGIKTEISLVVTNCELNEVCVVQRIFLLGSVVPSADVDKVLVEIKCLLQCIEFLLNFGLDFVFEFLI